MTPLSRLRIAWNARKRPPGIRGVALMIGGQGDHVHARVAVIHSAINLPPFQLSLADTETLRAALTKVLDEAARMVPDAFDGDPDTVAEANRQDEQRG